MNTFYNEASHAIAQVRVQILREAPASDCASYNEMNQAPKAVHFFHNVVAKSDWFDPEKECVILIFLDRRNNVRGWNLLSLGTLTSTLLNPREALRASIVSNASAVIIMHNHPSGDPGPSQSDMHATTKLRCAFQAVGDIALLDHVIIGEPGRDPVGKGYYSFREFGIL